MSITPNTIFSLRCVDSASQLHQILRGTVPSGNVDLAARNITLSEAPGAQWAALDAGSSQVFIKCLEEVKQSSFSTLGAIPKFFLEGKGGKVDLAPKTAAEDPMLTGTRWTVIDLGGNHLALRCDFLGKNKSTVGTSGGQQFLQGLDGGNVILGAKDAKGTHWEIVALGPSGELGGVIGHDKK